MREGEGDGRRTRLLHEDERFLAVDKPPGVSLATSGRPGHGGAEAVARLLAAAGVALPGPLPLLAHRLDAGTSGVVVLARDEEAHRAFTRALQERRARKVYRALVWGHPTPARGTLDAALGRDPRDGRRMRVDPGGKPSATAYATLRRHRSVADLELVPLTGRTHQIRVHLASRGHPIVGDDLYGGATRWRGVRDGALRAALSATTRPLLHAASLEVPELGLAVEAPLPDDYRALLAALEASRDS